MDNNQTGSLIYEIRKELGLSQKELADKIHVTDKAISKWETGKGMPDVSLLIPLAEALNISVAELLNGKKSETAILDSNAKIVFIIKNNKKKLTAIIIIIAIICALLISILPVYNYANSVNKNNYAKIESIANSYMHENDLKITDEKSLANYKAFYLSNDNTTVITVFERNKLYDNRFEIIGGQRVNDELNVYSFGEHSVIVNVFTDKNADSNKYTFCLGSTQYICNADEKDNKVFDLFVENSDGVYTNPYKIEYIY